MKISVSTYSFGRYNSMGMLALVDKTAELGLDGIEFVEGSYTGNEKELDAIHARIQEKDKNMERILVEMITGQDLTKILLCNTI